MCAFHTTQAPEKFILSVVIKILQFLAKWKNHSSCRKAQPLWIQAHLRSGCPSFTMTVASFLIIDTFAQSRHKTIFSIPAETIK